MSEIEKIMVFPILGIPISAYLFFGGIAVLIGTFLYVVTSCEKETRLLLEESEKYRKEKEEYDKEWVKYMRSKR